MTTLAEAKRELAQIAERQAELQKIVDAAPKSLLTYDNQGHCIGSPMKADGVETLEICKAYADALDTLLMLRHQPGTEPATSSCQYAIELDYDGPITTVRFNMQAKMRGVSPCFATEADALVAIDTIGADRILRMFRTLHGVAA